MSPPPATPPGSSVRLIHSPAYPDGDESHVMTRSFALCTHPAGTARTSSTDEAAIAAQLLLSPLSHYRSNLASQIEHFRGFRTFPRIITVLLATSWLTLPTLRISPARTFLTWAVTPFLLPFTQSTRAPMASKVFVGCNVWVSKCTGHRYFCQQIF